MGSDNAVNKATSLPEHNDIVVKVCLGRQGLGVCEAVLTKRWNTADSKEKRKMVTDEI